MLSLYGFFCDTEVTMHEGINYYFYHGISLLRNLMRLEAITIRRKILRQAYD